MNELSQTPMAAPLGGIPEISAGQTPSASQAPTPQKPKSKLLIWGGIIGAVVVAAAVLIYVLQKPVIYEGGRGGLALEASPVDCKNLKEAECFLYKDQCTWGQTNVEGTGSVPHCFPRFRQPVAALEVPKAAQLPSTETKPPDAAILPYPIAPVQPPAADALEPSPPVPNSDLGAGPVLVPPPQGVIQKPVLGYPEPPKVAVIPTEPQPQPPPLSGPPLVPFFDYKINSIANKTVTYGEKISFPITLERLSGVAQPVTLSASTASMGSPPRYAFNTNPCTPDSTCKPTLTIEAEATTQLGIHRVSVIGKPLGKVAEFNLTVVALPAPAPFDYKLSNSIGELKTVSIPKGTNTAPITIIVTKTAGTAKEVALSVLQIDPDVNYTFSSTTKKCTPNPTCTDTITIHTAATTNLGPHRVTVQGTPEGKVTEFVVNVIEPPPAPAFDYELSNSGDMFVQKGVSAVAAITVTKTAGTAKPVALSVPNITPDRPYFFNSTKGKSASCTPDSTCTESLFIDMKTAGLGVYSVTVIGDPGGEKTQFTVTVTEEAPPPVQPPGPPAPPAPPASEKLGCSITATPNTVTKGQQVTLEIKVTGPGIVSTVLDGTSVTLNNNTKTATKTVTPDASRSYVGTVKDSAGGIVDCSVQVTVNDPAVPPQPPPPPPVQCPDPKHVYDPVKKVCVPPSEIAETKCADSTYTFDPVKKVCVPPTTTTTTVAETKCADPTYKFDATRKVCVPPTEVVVTKTVTKGASDTGPVEDPTKTTKVITVKEPTYVTPSSTIPSTTTRQPYGTFIQGKTGPGILIYPAGIILANIGYYFAQRRKKNRL